MQPDTITGDIVFILQLKEHAKFKRKLDDLYVEHTLNLTEALCGFQFVLTHLDGRQLLVKSNPGEVIKPGNFPCLIILHGLNFVIQGSSNFFECRSIKSNQWRGHATLPEAIHEGQPFHPFQCRVSRLWDSFSWSIPKFTDSTIPQAKQAFDWHGAGWVWRNHHAWCQHWGWDET